MELQIEIMSAFVEILKTGGNYAIWGIIAWWVMNLIKVGIVAFSVVYLVKLICNSLLNYLTIKFMNNKDSISLLSDKVSEELIDTLKDYQASMKSATQSFITDANDLLKESRECKEKITKTASKSKGEA